MLGEGDVSAEAPSEWDASGEYAQVIRAVAAACGNDALRVYRVDCGSCTVSPPGARRV